MCRKEGPREHPPGRAGRGRPGQPPVDWSTYLVTSCRLLVPARGIPCSIVVPGPRSPPRPTQRLRRGSFPTSRAPRAGERDQEFRPECNNTLWSVPPDRQVSKTGLRPNESLRPGFSRPFRDGRHRFVQLSAPPPPQLGKTPIDSPNCGQPPGESPPQHGHVSTCTACLGPRPILYLVWETD
jgi:hypothetical protein